MGLMKKQAKMYFNTQAVQIYFFLFIFLFFNQETTLGISPRNLSLKENIFNSQEGDYIALTQGSQNFFLLIKAKTKNTIYLEEIFYPSLSQKDKNIPSSSWKEKITKITSPATVYLIALSKNAPDKIYKLNHKTKTLEPLFNNTSSILYLLNNNFKPITSEWTPTTYVEGIKTKLPTTAWKTILPKNRSLLSEQQMVIYLPDHQVSSFPILISITTPKGLSNIRSIDIGHNALSPYTYDLP